MTAKSFINERVNTFLKSNTFHGSLLSFCMASANLSCRDIDVVLVGQQARGVHAYLRDECASAEADNGIGQWCNTRGR